MDGVVRFDRRVEISESIERSCEAKRLGRKRRTVASGRTREVAERV